MRIGGGQEIAAQGTHQLGANKSLNMQEWFLREVERRAGATKYQMLLAADFLDSTEGTPKEAAVWLRRILGEKP